MSLEEDMKARSILQWRKLGEKGTQRVTDDGKKRKKKKKVVSAIHYL